MLGFVRPPPMLTLEKICVPWPPVSAAHLSRDFIPPPGHSRPFSRCLAGEDFSEKYVVTTIEENGSWVYSSYDSCVGGLLCQERGHGCDIGSAKQKGNTNEMFAEVKCDCPHVLPGWMCNR